MMARAFLWLLGAAMAVGLAFLIYQNLTRIVLDKSLLAPSVAYESAVRDGVIERSTINPGQRYLVGDGRFRILPLYGSTRGGSQNTNTDRTSERQESPRPIPAYIIRRKMAAMETLAIMPKWRWGVAKHGEIHPALLVDPPYTTLIKGASPPQRTITRSTLWGKTVRLDAKDPRFAALDGRSFYAHHLQTLALPSSVTSCTPMITVGGTMLLGDCLLRESSSTAPEKRFWLLTDPDLLNNLGIGFGDNASIARDLITALSADRKVVLDTTIRYFGAQPARQSNGPNLSELLDYLKPPYTGFWMAAIFLLILLIWQALRRSGPVRRADPALLSAPSQTSRQTTIAADARLMAASTSARDGFELAELLVQQGLDDLGRRLHGNGQDSGVPSSSWPRLRQRLERTAPDALAELETIRTAVNNRRGDVTAHIGRFQTLMGTIAPHTKGRS